MKKTFATIALLALCTTFAFAQTAQNRPVLAILPFTGGAGGDGEAIASLLSFEPAITNAFTVVPRTAALNALFEEHRFQLAGLTDADTIAGIGRMLNAQYVLSGSIRQIGDRNLVIATIINVQTFEQVAGYHLTYRIIEEVRPSLPSMSRNMVATAFRDTADFPNLAVLPLNIVGISAHEAETLAMILAIEIINIGGYAVLPRTSAIESALAEHDLGW
ncbi:MAG: penicillin-binding protein activator LpoB [Treponema sp.]|nr:penicillin-binding protein activator LpoB [Treponema sp.]